MSIPWPRRPREPREVKVNVAGLPPQHIPCIPSDLRIEHTIVHKPGPPPRYLLAVVRDPVGFQYRGDPFYIQGTPYVGSLYLPGNFIYFRNSQGEFTPMSKIDVEFGWRD